MVPIPRHYDATEGVYLVFGAVCSLGCAKAYILEHTTFDRGEHLSVLAKMARDLYGVQHVIETPPRASLAKFGGLFDMATTRRPLTSRVVEAPFVSYNMIVEEKGRATTHPNLGSPSERDPVPPSGNACTFERPMEKALFDDFLSKQAADPTTHCADATEAPVPPRPSAHAGGRVGKAGPMARFVK